MLNSDYVDELKYDTELENSSLIKNKIWRLIDFLKEKNSIGCKCVFKTKKTPDGKVEKRKARLVGKPHYDPYMLLLLREILSYNNWIV